MKKRIFLILIACISLLISCQGAGTHIVTQEQYPPVNTPTTSLISSPIPLITTTTINPLPSASETFVATNTLIAKETSTPIITQTPQADRNLSTQCLTIAPSFTGEMDSNGVIFLGTKAGGEQRRFDILQIDMDTGKRFELTTPWEYQVENAVSPDRKLMAYTDVEFDTKGNFKKYELIIANSNGTKLKTIPWEDKWREIMDWTVDQRLLLASDEAYIASDGNKIPISYLVLNPFTGEQELLQPDLPGFLDVIPLPSIFRSAIFYDPTLTRVIYPQLIPDNKEEYSLFLRDETTNKILTGLENIYLNGVGFSHTTPTPIWSPDGSQFAFRGQILVSDELVTFELYRVSRDGEIEQLTNLTPVMLIAPSRFSWSPDGTHIAILIDAWYTHNDTHLAVIDVNTHRVTDYCVPVRGLQYGAPIWSPDGTQLLVMDADEEGNNRKDILVDIVNNYAVQIAENYDPLGWMVSP